MRICLLVALGLAGCGSAATGTDGGADLAVAGADLAGADFAGVDFAGVDFAGVDLAGVDLAGGNFSFDDTFTLADGAPWPAPWQALGGVASSGILGGRARMTPITSGYALARFGVTAQQRDAEATFTLRFEDVGTQGVGFYLRQNGGCLQLTATHGAGYAVFVEGFRGSRMGLWREVDGVEMELVNFTAFTTPLASNVTYAVRLRVQQASASATHLQARLWDAALTEPTTWQLDTMDATATLQNVAGGIAVDSYSSTTSGTLTVGTLIDDVHVIPLP